MEILIFCVIVAVVLASYLLKVAVSSKGRQKKACFIKAIAVSVSAGTLAMLAYFLTKGIEFQLGLMVFQLILFSAVAFGFALLFALPIYCQKCQVQETERMFQSTMEQMLEILKGAGK